MCHRSKLTRTNQIHIQRVKLLARRIAARVNRRPLLADNAIAYTRGVQHSSRHQTAQPTFRFATCGPIAERNQATLMPTHQSGDTLAVRLSLMVSRMRIDHVRVEYGRLFRDQCQFAAVGETRIDAENAFALDRRHEQQLLQIGGKHFDRCRLGGFRQFAANLPTDERLD